MSGRRRLLPLLFPVLLASCASGMLYNTPTTLWMDGWTITLVQLQDGPSSWVEPAGLLFRTVRVRRGRGRLLHLVLKVRNDAPLDRGFPYEICDLDGGAKVFVPTLVIMSAWSDAPGMVEAYHPGEELRRELIYEYPDGVFPTRLRCGYAVWAMPRR